MSKRDRTHLLRTRRDSLLLFLLSFTLASSYSYRYSYCYAFASCEQPMSVSVTGGAVIVLQKTLIGEAQPWTKESFFYMYILFSQSLVKLTHTFLVSLSAAEFRSKGILAISFFFLRDKKKEMRSCVITPICEYNRFCHQVF